METISGQLPRDVRPLRESIAQLDLEESVAEFRELPAERDWNERAAVYFEAARVIVEGRSAQAELVRTAHTSGSMFKSDEIPILPFRNHAIGS